MCVSLQQDRPAGRSCYKLVPVCLPRGLSIKLTGVTSSKPPQLGEMHNDDGVMGVNRSGPNLAVGAAHR